MRKVFTKRSYLNIMFCLKWNLHERPTYFFTPKPCVSNNVERKLISLEIGGTHKNVNIVFNPSTLNSLIELFFQISVEALNNMMCWIQILFNTYINQRSFTRATFHVHLKRTWEIIGMLRNNSHHGGAYVGRQLLIFRLFLYEEKKQIAVEHNSLYSFNIQYIFISQNFLLREFFSIQS